MKLDKRIIDRRVNLLEKAGIVFKCNVNVGKDIKASELEKQFDRVVLCCGASNPRNIDVKGRDAKGIYFAVDFLKSTTKSLWDNGLKEGTYISAKGKDVIVIGGGDTGNDCVGTCIRHGCKSIPQLEMMPKAPDERAESNPGPQWPLGCKTDYGQEEAIALMGEDPRMFQRAVTECVMDKRGKLKAVMVAETRPEADPVTGRVTWVPVEGTEEKIKADYLFIAAGFAGADPQVCDTLGVELDKRSNAKTADSDDYQTSSERVFTAGDVHRGQSLVVWAIAEGRAAAKAVDLSLMGYTNL